MGELWHLATTMPTSVWSLLLALACVYWALVAVGAFDIDLFSIDADVDADAGVDVHAHGIFEFLSIGQVPITVIASIFVAAAWLLALAAVSLVPAPLAALPAGLAHALVLAVTALAALVVTAWTCRRMRPLFSIVTVEGGASLVGRQVTVTSGHVDERFGTASAATDGPDLLLNVVARVGVRLSRGEQAVVVEHDAERGVYLIAPLPHLRPGFLAEDAGSPAPPAADAPQAEPPPVAPAAPLLSDPAPAPRDTRDGRSPSTGRLVE